MKSGLDPVHFVPRLLAGDTTQGILTAKYIPAPQAYKIEPVRAEPLEPALLREMMYALLNAFSYIRTK